MAKSYDVGIRITAKDETGPALTKTRAGVESISRQLESMRAYALGAFTGVAALGQAREVLALADAVQSMNARLRLAVGGADAFAAAQARAYAISARTGAGYEATATLMARLSTVAKGYGVTQEQVFRVTEATGNALKVSGAGAQETASVIRQLSQAMGSGVLRGDEFNAIMENGTRLAQALADGLNVPIGKLRGLAEQGLLTTDIMVKALESQRETLAAEAAAMPKTIGMAATRVADEFGRIVDAANQGSGATGIMASALDALAVNLETVLGGAAVAAVGGLALVTARGASAAFDYAKALYAQMAAERQAMAVTLAHKEAAVSYALADVMRAQTVVNQTKGMARLDQVVNTLIPAQQRLTAAQQALTAAQNAGGIAARALSGALGFVGGPLGAITLALTVGATAWALWGDKAETATSRARKSAEDAQAALDRLRDRKQYGEDELAPVRKGIAELEAALAEMRRTEIQWDPETGEPREVRGYSDSDIQAAQARLDKMRQDLANAQQELASQAQGLAGIAASGVTNIMESAFARLEQGYKDKLDPLAAELEKLRKAAAEAGIATDSERFKQAEQLARDIFAKKSDINVSIGDVGKQLRDKTVKAIKDGVQYEFGAKNLSSLVIDCSGFVTALHAPVVKGIVEAQKGALPEDMVAALKSSSDGIITNVANITGDLVKTKANALDFSRLREGMLVGIDTGVTGFEKKEKPGTRTYGIDHIVSLVKDELGRLMVGESSGGKGVHWTPAEEWAKRFGDSVKAYVVDPYKNLRLPWETLGNYAKDAQEVDDLLTRSTQRTQQATMDALAYKQLEVEQTIAGDRRKLESAGATQEQLQQFDRESAALRTAILDEIAKEEQAANARRLQEARQHRQEIARIMQELGEATGDRGLQRAGLLADITAQAEALTLLAKSAEEFDLIQRQATLKAAQTRRDTAEDFAEYWRVSMDELGAISKAAGDQEQAIWGEVLQEWLTNSATMAAAREAAYGRVIEAAQAAGDAELAVMAQVARESAALERLQAIQQYGDPTAAFLARLSEGLREYQSEATKAREAAVQLADGLLQLKADAESALGQFAGDWVYGFLTGTATVEDAWENMLDNMARAFSDWVASLTTDWTKDILDMGLSLLKGGLSGLFNSHSPNISALINAPIVAKAKGDVMGAPGLSAYRNRIVSSPTFFPFATGIGLMGEAGPEAIMPLLGAAGAHRVRAVLPNGREDAVDLTRTASGHLGVQLPAWLANVQPCAEGWAPRVLSPSHTPLAPLAPLPGVQAGVRSGAQSGGSVKGGDGAAAPVMHVTVHNNAGADVSVQQSADGMNFDILVEKVAHGIAGQARRGKGPFAGRL